MKTGLTPVVKFYTNLRMQYNLPKHLCTIAMPPFPGQTDNATHRNIAHSSVHLQDKRLCITNKILSEKEEKRSKKTEFKAH